jgi:hypothetical protein
VEPEALVAVTVQVARALVTFGVPEMTPCQRRWRARSACGETGGPAFGMRSRRALAAGQVLSPQHVALERRRRMRARR